MPQRVLKTLVENFEVEDDIVVSKPHGSDSADWMALHRLPLPHLKDRAVRRPAAVGGRKTSARCSTTSASRTGWCTTRSTRSLRWRRS